LIAKLFIFRIVALACFLGTIACVARYPLGWVTAAAPLAGYIAILWCRPQWWLYTLPGLLPLLNLYPWTGSLYFEEFDLIVLATLAVGYWRASPRRPRIRLIPSSRIAIAALALSYAASAMIALHEVEDWRWSALASYNTPLNGLRVLKGFAWPLLLLPLLLRAADRPGFDYRDALGKAMLLGLTGVSIVVVWERWAFPGLLNFSSDYRAIGPFYEAHIGGAALDGYLALGLPFAIVFLMQARQIASSVAGAALLGLGAYATFATFSRGLYLGAAVAAAMIVVSALRKQTRTGSGFRVAALALSFGICALLLLQLFSTGGYRTLAAVLGFYIAAIYVGGSSEPIPWKGSLSTLLALSFTAFAIVQYLPKGAYVVYGIALTATVVLGTCERLAVFRIAGATATVSGWLGVCAIAVGWHWNGMAAMQDAAMAVLVVALLALYNRSTAGSLWMLNWATASSAIAAGLLLGIAIPVVGNYYMKERVQSVSRDLELRGEHWVESMALQGDGWYTKLAGAGLGRYPELYFWNNRKGEFPGTVLAVEEGARDFIRLGGGRNTPDLLRLAQRIEVEPNQTLTVDVTLRSDTPKAVLHVDVCEKWLLYTERCTGKPARFRPEGGSWQEASGVIYTANLGAHSALPLRPTILNLVVDRPGTLVDIDQIRVRDRSGRDLVANSGFQRGDHWFFTSDRSHLPWHAKNLWLGIWFDQGWFGLMAFIAFGGIAMLAALRMAKSNELYGAAIAASLAAFFVVGLFDSLLDATRLATLFYLLCMAVLVAAPLRTDNAMATGYREEDAITRDRQRGHSSHHRRRRSSKVQDLSRQSSTKP
jgi:hypothetical protein